MAFPIARHRQRIAELCRLYEVRRLDVFGSALRADFDGGCSDVDFLVDFIETRPEGAADRYFGLRQALQAELRRPVDLVMRSAVRNPYFLREAAQHQMNVYAA
jgi:predicted nucleotidyltransferase